jgi:hypothetical protein
MVGGGVQSKMSQADIFLPAPFPCKSDRANSKMKRIWNEYKVWIIIGLAYAGFYLFKGFKVLKRISSNRQTKLISSQSLPTEES